MEIAHPYSVPLFATVKRWTVEFKRGHTSLIDDECSERSITATTIDNINKIHQMILDRRIKIRLIVLWAYRKNVFIIY